MNKCLRSSVALLLCCGLMNLTGAADKPVHQDLLNNIKPQKVSEHVWMLEGPRSLPTPDNQGFMNNPGYIITADSVILIDPGSSAAIGRAVVAHIKQQTAKPVSHVFTTHIHGDHWLANQAIQEAYPDAQFFGHPQMIELAEAGAADSWLNTMATLTEGATAGTVALVPTEALEHGQTFQMGGITLTAHLAQEKAHTTSDVMYEISPDKVLFTGDNINHLRIVRMDDGSFSGNIAAADYALGLAIKTIVPGHGPKGDRTMLAANRDYLMTLHESVKVMREDDMESYEMKPLIAEKLKDFADWAGFEDELGRHISLSVLEAEEEDF